MVFVPASMWRMAGARASGRAARAPRSRAARRRRRWCCKPCRSAASPSSTAQTPTLKCPPNLCPAIAPSPARGKYGADELQYASWITSWILYIVHFVVKWFWLTKSRLKLDIQFFLRFTLKERSYYEMYTVKKNVIGENYMLIENGSKFPLSFVTHVAQLTD